MIDTIIKTVTKTYILYIYKGNFVPLKPHPLMEEVRKRNII